MLYFYKSTQISITRFQSTIPTIFQIGDIVEIQTTVIAVPIKDKQFKMVHQLRSIALINSSFAKVCSYIRNKSKSFRLIEIAIGSINQ